MIIIDTPYRNILDRDDSEEAIRKAFGQPMAVLSEVVNYGTHLIPRCLSSSKRDLSDLVLIGVLLKHALAMADAVHVLVSGGCVLAAHLQLRSLIETDLYSRFIMQRDTLHRARHYYVWHLRRRRRELYRLIKGTPQHKRFRQLVANELPIDVFAQEGQRLHEDAREEVRRIRHMLRKKAFREINLVFLRREMKKNRVGTNWFTSLQIGSIGQMARELGARLEYDWLYGDFSETIHGTDIDAHLNFETGAVTLEPLRGTRELDKIIDVTYMTITGVYRRYLDFYRPGELGVFGKKVLEGWKPRMADRKKIVTKVQPKTI